MLRFHQKKSSLKCAQSRCSGVLLLVSAWICVLLFCRSDEFLDAMFRCGVLFSTDLQRQIGEREGQLQAMYSDPELQKVNMLLTHYSNTIGGVA